MEDRASEAFHVLEERDLRDRDKSGGGGAVNRKRAKSGWTGARDVCWRSSKTHLNPDFIFCVGLFLGFATAIDSLPLTRRRDVISAVHGGSLTVFHFDPGREWRYNGRCRRRHQKRGQ